jgi:hypothetical protein
MWLIDEGERKQSWMQHELCIIRGQHDAEEECAPLDMILALFEVGALPRFEDAYFEYIEDSQLGNCHDVAKALMCDLIAADRAHGWIWVTGYVELSTSPYAHSWLECNGWALDGTRNQFLVLNARDYHEYMDVGSTNRMDARASRRWVERSERKLVLRGKKVHFGSLYPKTVARR